MGVAAAKGYVYQNREHGFTITLPEDWTVRTDLKSNHILVIAQAPSGESINVAVETLDKLYQNYTFDNLSSQEMADYIQQMMAKLQSINPGTVLQEWELKSIDGKKAVWLLLTVPVRTATSAFNMKTLHVQVLYNAKLYMVTCGAAAENYRHFRKLFEWTVNSLTFDMIGIYL
jgi:hypothetical protein